MRLLIIILICLIITGCILEDESNDESLVQEKAIDQQLSEIISQQKLTGNHFLNRDVPDVQSDLAQLGKHLFFSKSLSGNQDVACVSCHHPLLGGGDNLSLSIGVEAQNQHVLGLGRLHDSSGNHFDGGPTVPRNAPTTFNVAGWDKVLFHDGRIESIGKTAGKQGDDGLGIRTPESPLGVADANAGRNLAHAQVRFPLTSNEEMKGFDYLDKSNQQIRDYLASRIGGYGEAINDLQRPDYWLDRFRTAYLQPTATAEQLVTEQNVAFAISEYERSQVFANNSWRKYIEGDINALSEDAKQGALLFFRGLDLGGAGCSGCHSGDFMTDEKFHNIAMPQIGRGKGNGNDTKDDFGRFRETGNPADMYAFRTPSLLNVTETGPWGHAGAYTSLDAVTRHAMNPQQEVENYDLNQLLQPGIQSLANQGMYAQQAIQSVSFEGQEINFSDKQVNELVAFLYALTDPCILSKQCMSPWLITDTEEMDPNGDQIIAIDADGNEF